MAEITKEKMIEVITTALPYANQIRDYDLSSEEDAMRFAYRGDRFRVSTYSDLLRVEQVEGGFLSGSNIAIVMEALLKRTLIDMMQYEDKKPRA